MTAIDVQMGSAEHFEAPVTDEQLQERFSAERLSGLCKEFIVEGPHGDLREKLDGRPFIVATVAGTDTRFRDIAKSTETIEFAKRFKRSWSQVYNDYKDTDPNSTFLVAIDNSDPDAPRPIGVVRMIEGNTVDALKDMKALVADDFDPEVNPWRGDLEDLLFGEDEEYSSEKAWRRLNERAGVDIRPEESIDVATIAVHQDYADKGGALDGTSIKLYNNCLRYALAAKKKVLVSIQDLKPLENIQQFGSPFDTFKGVPPREYGGPYKTLPAYSVLEVGMQKIRDNNEFYGQVFIDGFGLSADTLMMGEIDPDNYSNEAVNLPIAV